MMWRCERPGYGDLSRQRLWTSRQGHGRADLRFQVGIVETKKTRSGEQRRDPNTFNSVQQDAFA